MKEFLRHFSVRSIVILSLLGGSIYLAIKHEEYRSQFADLAKVGLGGYLGQLIPRERE
jgi:hypothetical protein